MIVAGTRELLARGGLPHLASVVVGLALPPLARGTGFEALRIVFVFPCAQEPGVAARFWSVVPYVAAASLSCGRAGRWRRDAEGEAEGQKEKKK